MLPRSLLLVSSLAASLLTSINSRADRRIVDTVQAGNAESEYLHGYAGHDDTTGVANDTAFRQARGWMRYAMTAFDDTQVTVACTFVVSDNAPRQYDIVVEDSLIASRTFSATGAGSGVVEIAVPFAVTKGKINIAVTIRGRGGPTPPLRELRIIQDHHEQQSFASVRAVRPGFAAPSSISQNPIGVAR